MSIHFVTGKPGGGKGLTAMQMVIDELREGKRPVITNLAIEMEPWVASNGEPQRGLRQYLLHKYQKDFGCRERVWRITDEQAGEFYLCRIVDGQRIVINCKRGNVPRDAQPGAKGPVIEYDTEMALRGGGVLYVVDECWKFWGSRNWQSLGPGLLFAGAQHRKFGEDWILCTQFMKQLDAQIRPLGQDFAVVRNHSKERFGIFRQPSIFTRGIYQEPPGPSSTASEKHVFKLDKAGLAGCYDTTSGVGISGRGVGDMGEKQKGLPLTLLVLGIVAIGAFVCIAPHWFGRVVGKGMIKGLREGEAAARKQYASPVSSNAPGPNVGATVGGSGAPVVSVPSGGAVSNRLGKAEVWLVAMWTERRASGETRFALMSDGTQLASSDREVSRMGPDWLMWSNRIYRLRRAAPVEERRGWASSGPMPIGGGVVLLPGAGRPASPRVN